MPSEKLMHKVNLLISSRGEKGLKLAQKAVADEKFDHEPLREALDFFMNEIWFDPMHPALLSLASEAVGGKPEETAELGAAFVLLAGGADIHDDIIDQSKTKGGKSTIYGKFGTDIAVLTGDALLFEGLYLLHDAVRSFQERKRQQILVSIKEAFWKISSGEAKEASFRGRMDISGEEYFEIINMKVAVAEATTKIGAILGDGTTKEISLLSHYGRTFGILNTVRDEFVDIYEAEEIKNRAEKECLPLPILLTLRNSKKREAILQLLEQSYNRDICEKILDLTVDSKENHILLSRMKKMIEQENVAILEIRNCRKELQLLLRASLEDL
jgi:geranylgeranyl pyrophosphate synthase